MKLTSKASLAFKKTKPDAKISFGNNVVNALTPPPTPAKTKFNAKVKALLTDLPIPVDNLQELNTNLTNAVAEALTGKHSAVASVKNAVAAWDYAFTLTANYISSEAEGDVVTIRDAGFVPTKGESQPAQKPGVPTGFKATINGSRGAIIAGSKNRVDMSKAYVFSAAPDGVTINYVDNVMMITVGDKSVYITVDTRRQTELYNLPSGVPFNVSMYAINAAGSGPATATQQVIPQ